MDRTARNAATLAVGMPKLLLRAVSVSMLLATAGCGVTYFSPSVVEGTDDAPVTVVSLTPQEVAHANQSSYTPKQLPDVFFAAAGGGSSQAGLGALPAEPYLPTETRGRLEFRPLPDVPPEAYRIGVGDVLLLATRGSATTIEQLSGLIAAQNQRQGYTVRDDGAIAIPDIGSVELSGLTLEEAEDKLFQVLVQNQIDPSFSLEVAEFNSKKIAVGGAVERATLVPVTLNPVTLSQALTAAGGLIARDEEFASIRIYREGTLYQIPVSKYLEQADLQKKVLLSGDAVFVDTTYDLDRAMDFYKSRIDVISLRSSARTTALSALQSEIGLRRAALQERRDLFTAREALGAADRDYVYLTGEVTKQSRVPLPYNRQATLADVLYGEGGFSTKTGNPAEIYVLRSTDGSGNVTAYHLNAKNAVNLVLATQMQMRPNDVVFVEEQPITKWSRALQQLFPVLINSAATSGG